MKGKKQQAADKDLEPEELIAKYGTKSAAIRILAKQGMPTADIARKMNVIYQHARNVLKRPLKRQMRR